MLDASIVVAWCFEDEKTSYTEKILESLANGNEALVPLIWPIEVTNALLTAERKKRITEEQVAHFLTRLGGFMIHVDAPTEIQHTFEQVISHARKWNLTSYDAVYLELSLREGLPLATLDLALRKAARGCQIRMA